MPTPSELLPLEPFVAILEEGVQRLGTLDKVIRAVAQIDDPNPRAVYRCSLYRAATSWRNGSRQNDGRIRKRITFSVADRIVTNLLGPEAWHTRPDLCDLYER